MQDERDIIVMSDEDGNEIEMTVLRYFFYNGEEYAMVTEADNADCCEGCHSEGCDCGHDHDHDHEPIEVFFMKVEPVDDENEEYSFVDEKLSAELLRVVESDMDDDEDEEDEASEK